MRRTALIAITTALCLTACGGDDSTEPGSRLEEFCSHSEAMDAAMEPPSDEDLERIRSLAPDELADEVAILIESAKRFRAGDQNAADSKKIQQAGNRFDAYREDNCPNQ